MVRRPRVGLYNAHCGLRCEAVARVDLLVTPRSLRQARFERIRQPTQETNGVVPALDRTGQDQPVEGAAEPLLRPTG
jgi:hypothetical protein